MAAGAATTPSRQQSPRHGQGIPFQSPTGPSLSRDGREGIDRPIYRQLLSILALTNLLLGSLFMATSIANAGTSAHHLVIALPAGLSPRTVGFYLAEAEGYFADRGLQIDFVSNPGQSPSQMLADGKADLAVDLMPTVLRLRQGGAAIQHVAQYFQHSSLALYCRPPIAKPVDLHGTTIGVWFAGEESSFYAWMSELNISTFGEEDGVTVLRQGRVSEALADARLDCVTSASYLAPQEMQSNGIVPTSRTIFRYEELGVGTLEDGLYARSRDLQNKEKTALFVDFLRASIRGWQKLHDDRNSALRLFHYRDGLDADQTDHTDSAADASTATGTVAVKPPTSPLTGNKTPIDHTNKSAKQAKRTKTDDDDAPIVETTHQAVLTDGAAGADLPAVPASAKPQPAGINLVALKASLDAVDAMIDANRHPIGFLDPQSYDRTVNLLLTGAPEPVLKSAPVDAISDLVWKRLRQENGQIKP
jgi:NitT/TauT family transport system substrate-binding protein